MKNLIVEISSRCNISCAMCIRQSWKDATGDMDMEVFRSLLPSFSRLNSLNLSGYGEPFLNPHLVSMIRLAREEIPKHARITLTTNATLVEEAIARTVLEAGLDGIALSMDSLEPDQFEAIRDGTALRTVTNCLESFVNLKKKLYKDFFSLGISFVAMKRNIRELPWLIQFAADHHVNSIWVNNLLPHTGAFSTETLYDSHSGEVLELLRSAKERLHELKVSPSIFRDVAVKLSTKSFRQDLSSLPAEEKLALQFLREVSSEELSMGGILASILQVLERDENNLGDYLTIFQKSYELAASLGIELYLPLIIPRATRECNFIRSDTCFVSWDGWIRPCNQLAHTYTAFHYGRPKRVDSVSFGRIPGEDLETIWNSEAYRTFRKNVEEFRFSPCGDCGLSEGCGYLSPDSEFFCDCNLYYQPCGDCLWSRGILNCP